MLKQPARGNDPAVSRRNILAGLAAVSAGGATAVAVSATPRDPHRAWLEEWYANRDEVNAHPTGEGPEVDALDERRYHLEDLIVETPPRSMDGIKAQMQWLVADGEDFWCCDQHRQIAKSLSRSLEALA